MYAFASAGAGDIMITEYEYLDGVGVLGRMPLFLRGVLAGTVPRGQAGRSRRFLHYNLYWTSMLAMDDGYMLCSMLYVYAGPGINHRMSGKSSIERESQGAPDVIRSKYCIYKESLAPLILCGGST